MNTQGIKLMACLAAGACLALAAMPSAAQAPAKPAASAPLPDWSGVWNPRERNLFDSSALPENQKAQPVDPLKFFEASYLREYPPYKPEWEARYVKTLTDTQNGIGSDPTAACLPGGFPRMLGTPYPMEFLVQPKLVAMLFEANSQMRHIYTDGRKHPDDLEPTFNGHSIGHWEGDTLVVDTVGLRGDTIFDVSGAPHSDKLHVTEHIRRISPTVIEDKLVIEDPVAFTKPWLVTRGFVSRPDWDLTEYVCEENQRNPILPDGTTAFIGPHEKLGPQAKR